MAYSIQITYTKDYKQSVKIYPMPSKRHARDKLGELVNKNIIRDVLKIQMGKLASPGEFTQHIAIAKGLVHTPEASAVWGDVKLTTREGESILQFNDGDSIHVKIVKDSTLIKQRTDAEG